MPIITRHQKSAAICALLLAALTTRSAAQGYDPDDGFMLFGWQYQTLLVDISGVNWTGEPRAHHSGENLSPDRITIHVRHASDTQKWAAPDPSHRMITLPSDFTRNGSGTELRSMLRDAYSSGKPVHLIVDTNITLLEHLNPFDRSPVREDIWAADVADFAAQLKPKGYFGALATHSRGTKVPLQMSSLPQFGHVIVESPRGDASVAWIDRLMDRLPADNRPQIDIVRGRYDAPSVRPSAGLGGAWYTSLDRLLASHDNVRILEFQDRPTTIGLKAVIPWEAWKETHSALSNMGTRGYWDIKSSAGTDRHYGTLATMIQQGQRALGSSRPPAIRNMWIDERDMRVPAQMLSAADSLTRHAGDASSVVVVGQGPAADRMFESMSQRVGMDNVHRITSPTSTLDVQRMARDFGADLILGARNETFNERFPGQTILAARPTVERLASTLDVLSTGMRAFDRPGAPRKEVHEMLGRAQDVYSVARGIESDIAAWNDNDFTLLRSETLEAVSRLAIDRGVGALAEQAAARVSGSTKFAPTFGLESAAHGALRHIRDGRADITTIEHYLDSAVGATWAYAALAGTLAVTGNPIAAQRAALVAQKSGMLLAQTGRSATQEWAGWDSFYRTNFGTNAGLQRNQQQMDANWTRTGQLWRDSGFEQQAARLMDMVAGGATFDELTPFIASTNAEINGRAWPPSRPVPGPGATPRNFTTTETLDNVTNRHLSDASTATRLARDSRRTVVFGYGPVARHTYDSLARTQGAGNVRWVHDLPDPTERMRIAADFGADSIRAVEQTATLRRTSTFSQTHNQVVGGHRQPSTGIPIPQPSPNSNRWASGASRAQTPSPSFVSPGVGGVMLRGSADVDGMRPEDFSLVFTDGTGEVDITQLRMFVTALWAVYFSDDGPGISIDPIAKGIDKHLVRYIGHVLNSDLGRVMRETDYLMKKWAIGTERPDIDGFLSPDDIAGRKGVINVGAASRFWFVPEDLQFTRAGDMLLFTGGRMTLQTEYLSHGLARKTDPANEEFARAFTNSYGVVSERYPIFRELFEYAKLVSLAKYLKEQQVPLLWFLLSNRDMVLTEDSPGTVDAFVTKSRHFEGVTIEGGVDLAIKPAAAQYHIDAEAATALAIARERARRDRPDSPTPSRGIASPRVRNESVSFTSGESAYSVTDSASLSLSDTPSGDGDFQTDLALRSKETSGLELIRYRQTRSARLPTFGEDWHLAIPFEIAPGSEDRVELHNVTLPRLMRITNLLTNHTETLAYDTERYSIAGWVPRDGEPSATLGLFIMSDGSFRMADRLGAEYRFDEAGFLTDMFLTDDYHVAWVYDLKTVVRAGFDQEPWSLSPTDRETVVAGAWEYPRQLTLRSHTGEEELFTFDEQAFASEDRYLYRSARADPETRRELVIMQDESFQLRDEVGNATAFDQAGSFVEQHVRVVRSVTQGGATVRFNYEFDGCRFRIRGANVELGGADPATHAIAYDYDESDRLTRVSGPGERVCTIVNRETPE